MEIKYTNFDGDWSALCEYCGKPNENHQISAGVFDDVKYIHHQPCDEQLQHSKQCAVPRGFVPRLLQRMRARHAIKPQKSASQNLSKSA